MAVDRSLPFEMRALEGALANVSRLLTDEAAALEARAMPAADRLAKRVTFSSLKPATCPCMYSAADCLAKQVSLITFPCVKGQCCQLWAGLAMAFCVFCADRRAAKERAYMLWAVCVLCYAATFRLLCFARSCLPTLPVAGSAYMLCWDRIEYGIRM